VGKDLKRAALLYQRAADKGHPEAQYDLGICFVTGQGMRKDEGRGLELMKRAAEQGQTGARTVGPRINLTFARGATPATTPNQHLPC
jgi:TPR repeat protein